MKLVLVIDKLFFSNVDLKYHLKKNLIIRANSFGPLIKAILFFSDYYIPCFLSQQIFCNTIISAISARKFFGYLFLTFPQKNVFKHNFLIIAFEI